MVLRQCFRRCSSSPGCSSSGGCRRLFARFEWSTSWTTFYLHLLSTQLREGNGEHWPQHLTFCIEGNADGGNTQSRVDSATLRQPCLRHSWKWSVPTPQPTCQRSSPASSCLPSWLQVHSHICLSCTVQPWILLASFTVLEPSLPLMAFSESL